MLNHNQIIQIAEEKGKLRTRDVSDKFSVSRQYVSILIAELVAERKLIKIGSTKSAFYVTPAYANAHKEIFPVRYAKSFPNKGLEEHKLFSQIENAFPKIKEIPENIRSIFAFAFSEMLNNAIEHSNSVRVGIEVSIQDGILSFVVKDSGVGVFRNVMKKKELHSETEAIQDILKGKTTTMPKSHSGEGIFFTSKAGDLFVLDSFGYQMIVDNTIPDIFVKTTEKIKRGTQVSFRIPIDSERHLTDIFRKYTNLTEESDYGFDKTEIWVKLYTSGGIHISRSQARRVLVGLEKFKIIVFDFDKVPLIGQAFADEVFRVFHTAYPHIKIEAENMEEGVKFMIERAKNEANKELQSTSL